ncbi:MAG TPA: hypothetical protein VFM08_15375, partial [Nocardioides sp.]|nr:hypothetical protein [Nocardioides sp.]
SGHGLFELEARYRKDGSPSGQVGYVFPAAGGDHYVVQSTGWQGGGLDIPGAHATIAGTCDVVRIDARGHATTVGTGIRFRLDVTDNGRSDTFALSVYTPEGMLFHRVGTPREPVAPGGGQVVVHR